MSAGKHKYIYPITWTEVTKGSSLIAVAVAGLTAAAALFGSLDAVREPLSNADVVTLNVRTIEAVRDLRKQIAQLKIDQAALIKGDPRTPADVRLNQIVSRLDSIEAREARLEQAIMSNPEKALAMPLLRRDLDAAKEANVQGIAAVKASVDQVYDLTKWFIGALAVGIFSLAIPNLLSRRRGAGEQTE